MKKLVSLFALTFLFSFSTWQNNFETALSQAKAENKYLLLNFSGSDWCANCIMLKKQIFENQIFIDFAAKNLVLLNADFPRQKKNQLLPEQQKLNNQLADKYNKTGIFPLTILISPEGKIIKKWEGKPKEDVEGFVQEIKDTFNK
jgi:thioredoxin-related protein